MNNIYFALTALFLFPTVALAELDDFLLNTEETSEIAIEDATDEMMTRPINSSLTCKMGTSRRITAT